MLDGDRIGGDELWLGLGCSLSRKRLAGFVVAVESLFNLLIT
jgi:hypothetical protein